jgi:hypothetical protein
MSFDQEIEIRRKIFTGPLNGDVLVASSIGESRDSDIFRNFPLFITQCIISLC